MILYNFDIQSHGIFLGNSHSIFMKDPEVQPLPDFDPIGHVDPTSLNELKKMVVDLTLELEVCMSEIGKQKIRLESQKRQIDELQDQLCVLSTPINVVEPTYLTTQQVSEKTGYSTDFINQKRKEKLLEPTGKSGKSYKFHKDEVERFMSLKDLNSPRERKSKIGQ